MTETVEIYALLEPGTGEVRYVGKAKCSHKRLKAHIRDSRRRRTPVYIWMARLLAAGKAPTVKILETCEVEAWPDRERFHIAEYRKTFQLLNVADGGDEPFCPPEIRSANGRNVAKIRKPLSPERKELMHLKQRQLMNLRYFERNGYFEIAMMRRQKMRDIAAKVPRYFSEWAAL